MRTVRVNEYEAFINDRISNFTWQSKSIKVT